VIDPIASLKDLKPEHGAFVGIDSDGCVFDSMEIKHKECFCPAFINHFDLQPIAKYAREAWEFVNLYSKSRGCNRFHAVLRAMELLRRRPEVQRRAVEVPRLAGLAHWVERETKLGNPALKREVEANHDPDLERCYRWSLDVNEAIERIVRNVPPFPQVRGVLAKLREAADVLVVSQTPGEALQREWREHRIDSYVRVIAGQEMGTKTEHLRLSASGKYAENRMLMIGDAPGDLDAARSSGALFYPVNPGAEEESWQRLDNEALERFFSGRYAGDFERGLIREFDTYLPERAPWEHSS
jgi:phosphoglycolate phosphatase-like HAD superfamily hydrolase